MQLIDWYNLFANALWIVALAISLTALGFAWWEAGAAGASFRSLLGGRGYQTVFNLSGILFSVGVGMTESRAWAQVLWGLLALAFAWQTCLNVKDAR